MSRARDEEARAALRARQGAGARYDAETAPAADLLLARRGAAFFARQVVGLSDAALAGPARTGGRSRAHVVAEVSLRARAMALALEGLREGRTPARRDWASEIDLAVTLPPRALRTLLQHCDVHLDVEFRDLPADLWSGEVALGTEGAVPAGSLPLRRARDLWTGALDLNHGAREADLPPRLRGG